MKKKFFAVGLALVLWFVPAAAWSGWTFLTEELPPFNFAGPGQVDGIAADLLLEMMQRAGYRVERSDIHLMPWPRAYNTVLKTPDTVLFSAARTRQRENLFQWVGPIMDLTIGLTARRDRRIRIETIDDARRYTIGTIRDGAPEQLVVKAGIPEESLDRIADPELNIKKLAHGRIDLFAFNIPTTRYLMVRMGFDPDDYEVVYVLKEARLYYAFNRDTDDAVIARLNKILRKLKEDRGADGRSVFERTKDRYLCVSR